MNIKLKTALIIIVTFILGIVIGAMFNRTLSQNRIKNILSRRNPVHFVSSYERIIGPDASQRKLVREVLNKHAKRISGIRTNYNEELQSSIESLFKDLDPLLTPQQKMRLKKRLPARPAFMNRHMMNLMRMDINKEFINLKEELGLSEEQSVQVRQVLEEWRNKYRMLREKRGAFMSIDQLMQMEKEKNEAIEKILNPEQKKIYEKIKKDRQRRLGEEVRNRRRMINSNQPLALDKAKG